VERYLKALTTEIGLLKGKRLFVLCGQGSAANREFVSALEREHGIQTRVRACPGTRLRGVAAASLPQDAQEADAVVCLETLADLDAAAVKG